MTDKVQKIREEVQRLHNLLPVMDGDNISVNYADRICTALEKYIDSLQEEPVSEELDEAAKNHAVERYRATRDMVLAEKCKWSFKEGAEWQKKQDQSTIELAEDHAMLAGMEKMKEEMMAKAVEVTVHIDAGNYPYIPQIELYDYDKDVPLAKEGDKYKVVLIKE